MAQWKKLLFDHDVTDIDEDGEAGGHVWRFSTGKAIAWTVFFAVLTTLAYGFWFADTESFFRQLLLYVIILAVGIVAVLFAARVTLGARKAFVKFFLLFIVIVFVYGVLSTIFGAVGLYPFHMGLSTWIMLTSLAGFGATRAYIFNGNLDRHDVFYCLLVFVIMAGGNWPITGGEGVLAHIDGLIDTILGYLHFLPLDGLQDTVNDTVNNSTGITKLYISLFDGVL